MLSNKRPLKFKQLGKTLLTALSLAGLTACSNPTIHLFGAKDGLAETLQANSQYKVISRSNDNVETFSQNTLISPSDLSPQGLQELIQVLKQQQIDIDRIAYGSYRNHSYQKAILVYI